MEELEIRVPDDFHLHLRRGEILETVLPLGLPLNQGRLKL